MCTGSGGARAAAQSVRACDEVGRAGSGFSGSAWLYAAWGGGIPCFGERLACVHGLWRRARCCAGLRARDEVVRAGVRIAQGSWRP